MLKFVSLTAAVALLATPALAQSDTAAPAAKPIRTTTGMMRYDANKDGIVDRAEWNAGQQARFQELDKNGDGKISVQEFSPGGTTDKREAAFRRLDTDRDGAVSQAEFMAQADRNFARCDADKDGKITTAECRQALQRRPVDKAKLDH
jgi:EF-hand domain pair/EF hand